MIFKPYHYLLQAIYPHTNTGAHTHTLTDAHDLKEKKKNNVDRWKGVNCMVPTFGFPKGI